MGSITNTSTIAAIATAAGQSALAIVRVSGPESIFLVDKLFSGASLSNAATQTLHVGQFVSQKGRDIDQVVIGIFKAPASATGEDVVEISCHGGDRISQIILQELIDSGLRIAEAGEFTKRAFLNGKIDLAQAESIAELIHSKSTSAHTLSLAHLEGSYSKRIEEIATKLLETVALVELELDFSEEDVEFADRSRLEELLSHTYSTLDDLLGSYKIGAVIQGGVDVVIAGKPNAGKSTLLNALVGYDRAIVSSTPGTTRDKVDAETEIGGILFRFHDTAGIRDTDDQIEAEGVRRAIKASDGADVLLYLFDASEGLGEDESFFLEEWKAKRKNGAVLLVANKSDLDLNATISLADGKDIRRLSALKALDDSNLLSELRDDLVSMVGLGEIDVDQSKIVSNLRHRDLLAKTKESVVRAQEGLAQGSGETLSKDIRDALFHLGAITGETTNEDILGAIFSRFCIGK